MSQESKNRNSAMVQPRKILSPQTQLTDQQVRHVAKLSRLALSDEQIHCFAQQLSGVLEHVSKLMVLNVEQIEPMAHPMDITNALRQDEPEAAMPVDAVLANAPDPTGPFFKVPKVLGDGSGA